jgi:hypothetical protein
MATTSHITTRTHFLSPLAMLRALQGPVIDGSVALVDPDVRPTPRLDVSAVQDLSA